MTSRQTSGLIQAIASAAELAAESSRCALPTLCKVLVYASMVEGVGQILVPKLLLQELAVQASITQVSRKYHASITSTKGGEDGKVGFIVVAVVLLVVVVKI